MVAALWSLSDAETRRTHRPARPGGASIAPCAAATAAWRAPQCLCRLGRSAAPRARRRPGPGCVTAVPFPETARLDGTDVRRDWLASDFGVAPGAVDRDV